MYIVGIVRGGYALCTTEQFQSKSYRDANKFKKQLDNKYSTLTSKAQALLDHGLVAYEWRHTTGNVTEGVGIRLNRIV